MAARNVHNLRTVTLVAMSRSESSARPGGQLIDPPVSRLSNRITYRPPTWCARGSAVVAISYPTAADRRSIQSLLCTEARGLVRCPPTQARPAPRAFVRRASDLDGHRSTEIVAWVAQEHGDAAAAANPSHARWKAVSLAALEEEHPRAAVRDRVALEPVDLGQDERVGARWPAVGSAVGDRDAR